MGWEVITNEWVFERSQHRLMGIWYLSSELQLDALVSWTFVLFFLNNLFLSYCTPCQEHYRNILGPVGYISWCVLTSSNLRRNLCFLDILEVCRASLVIEGITAELNSPFFPPLTSGHKQVSTRSSWSQLTSAPPLSTPNQMERSALTCCRLWRWAGPITREISLLTLRSGMTPCRWPATLASTMDQSKGSAQQVCTHSVNPSDFRESFPSYKYLACYWHHGCDKGGI